MFDIFSSPGEYTRMVSFSHMTWLNIM